jgi:hypothetical protein
MPSLNLKPAHKTEIGYPKENILFWQAARAMLNEGLHAFALTKKLVSESGEQLRFGITL